MPKTARSPRNTLAASEHRRSIWVRVGVTAALVAFALIVSIIVIATRTSSTQTAAAPTSVAETGALRAASPNVELAEGTSSPKRVLTIFEDFQCPVCKNFEASFGGTLDELRTDGIAAIDYHPIAILDRMSSTDYSTRAANASLCVADSSIDTWLGFHSAVYEQQPAEGGSGLSDEQLTDIAVAAGAPDTAGDCVTGGHHTDWVADSTQSVLDTNIDATPTVLLNGEPLDLSTPAALDAAVRAIP